MLNLITGGNHTNRERTFIDMIKASADAGKDVLVIIPDQFSFEYDKKLYNALGAKQFNKIKTAGFNRLAELVAKQYGYDSKDNADDNATIIIMYKAVKRLKDTNDVRFYKKALTKNSFIAESIDLINELVRSGITYSDLRIASEQTDGTLSAKLYDLSHLYEFFMQELENAGMKSNLTAVGECCELVEQHKYFSGKTVFIDSFTDFSVDEYKLIESMLKQADSVSVSLVVSHENKALSNRTPFAETIRTAHDLKNLAKKYNISYNEIRTLNDNDNDISHEIEHIDVNLYRSRPDVLVNSKNVSILSATDLYEETEYVCAEISRLVRDEHYKYNDIAVVAGNIAEISPVLEGVFERYEIPIFIDSKKGSGQSALVIYLKSIFDCVMSKKWNTEKLLKYVKSPLSGFLDYDICDLENYCLTWSVNGDMWLEDFTAKPSEGSLSRINQTRKQIIDPLLKFKNKCQNVSVKDLCSAFYQLLDDIDLSQHMFSKIKSASSLGNDAEFELAREFKQLWTTVLSAVSSIYTNMDDEQMSLREFYDIFSLMISQITVSRPPQKADCVRIASTDHSRLSDVKAVFVIEANYGVFPAEIRNSGLLTVRDKRNMEKIELSVSNNSMHQLESERLNVYMALTLASDKLYVLYSESDLKGDAKNPSMLVTMMNRMFDNAEQRVHNIDTEFFCTSYRTAMYKFLEKNNDRKVNVASIKESLESSAEYSDKLENILDASARKEHHLTESMSDELFFSHDLNLSATKLNDYYSCPFMYYCKYGLKLRQPQPVDINRMNKGNLIHSCFEGILSTEDSDGKRVYNQDFVNFDDDKLREMIHGHFKKYIDENMGGDFGKTASFNESVKRLEDSAFYAVKNVQTELENTLFVPSAFEYNLTKKDGESILQLEVDKGVHINIRGSIDRVDIFTADDGQKYVRIIDYKTGSTSMKLEELYNGLNLQMLVYLIAITQRVNELNPDGELKPSAILYSHIKFIKSQLSPEDVRLHTENNDLDDELVLKRASAFKPDGMMIENEITFDALNKKLQFAFTPIKTTPTGKISSKNDTLVTEAYFMGLEQFALGKIYNMAENLRLGDIAADPIQKANSLTCTYCDYWGICGNSSPKNPRTTDKTLDTQSLNNEIQDIVSGKNN